MIATDDSVPTSDNDTVEQALRAEQLDRIYQQAARNQFFSPLVAALMSLGLWDVRPHGWLLAWVLAMALASVGRQALARRYLARDLHRLSASWWERRFLVSTTLVALGWGLGGWFLMADGDAQVNQYVYVFLMGMSGGTATIYAAHGRTVMLAITGILLPPTLRLVLQGDVPSLTLALGGVLFVVAMSSSVRLLRGAMRRSAELAQQLERQSRIDALSGLPNRRALLEAGHAMLAQAARAGRGCAALMIDVDHFKRVNDTRGHAAGDAVIAALGALLSRTVRTGEWAGRFGGEEFVVLLPDADAAQAAAVAARLLANVRATPVEHADGPIAVTVSIGLAVAQGGSLQALLERADQALYRAKAGGRDRIERDDTAPGAAP